MDSLKIVLLSLCVGVALATNRCIDVTGRVSCGPKVPGKHMKFTRINLNDLTGRTPSAARDKLIEEALPSTISGNFYLHGCMEETRNNRLEPYLLIHHDCTGHKQVWFHRIPDQYIGRGSYDMGEVSLLNPDFQKFPTRTPYDGPIVTTCS